MLGTSGGRDEILSENRAMGAGPDWGLAKQQWYIQTLDQGVYKIINRCSGKVLTSSGVFVAQANFINSDNQNWVISRSNSNSGYVLSALNSGQNAMLNYTNTTSIEQQYFGAGSSFRWNIVDVSNDVGVYAIKNLLSDKALEVGGADLSGGANVNQWSYYGLANQQWVLQPVGNGDFYIQNRNTWQALEMGGSYSESVSPGRVGNQWPYWGGDNQQWGLLDVNDSHQLTLAEASDGRPVKLYNRRSGKVLEIGGNGSEHYQDGRAANQWYDWSGPNQQWVIQFVSPN